MYMHKCVVCGKNFSSQHPFAKYCSPECKKIAHKQIQREINRKYIQKQAEQRRAEKKEIVGKCEICGSPVKRSTGKRKYCSDECVEIAKRLVAKNYYHQKYKFKKVHEEKVRAELKEIRKKSQLNKNLKDLGKNSEKLGLKSYDYGKYAHLKGL